MNEDLPSGEQTWVARTVRPRVLAYLVAVFIPFFVLAHFGVHSPDAVKALAAALVGGVASLTPALLSRMEYRLSDAGVEKRPVNPKNPRKFKRLFSWDDLSHLTPTKTGFKYFKHLEEPSPVRRFWKLHVLDDYSGELHIETADRAGVQDAFAHRGVPFGRPVTPGRLRGG